MGQTWLPIGKPIGFAASFAALATRVPTAPEQIAVVFAMDEGGQVILLLNRRGFENFWMCRACGKPLECAHCAISLTYHKGAWRLRCHLCGFEAANERTRPNLKVQDGCDNRCSFCVIPFVRGDSRSLSIERVLAEAQALVDTGYKELVISGINLGRWGKDLAVSSQRSAISVSLLADGLGIEHSQRSMANDQRLASLVRAILEGTSLEKLRISSVEPMDWTDELIELVAGSPRIAKHAHVPMQSGSDRVLRAMHRKYRPRHYEDRIRKARALMPNAAARSSSWTAGTSRPGSRKCDILCMGQGCGRKCLHQSQRPRNDYRERHQCSE